jgi:enediyne biosynthesis protein E4
MSQPSFAKMPVLIAIPVVLVILGVAGYLIIRNLPGHAGGPPSTESADTSGGNASPGFRECARESRITFRMAFLPNEQGERFKINLYDHGCGVAVGDYNGDGRDDIYFVNQLGENVLYRNNGDGSFTDVTHEAGVALGDRICVGATFADYDNSGRQSLFVTSTRGGNVLFRNKGDGTFEDVTKDAGLTCVKHSQTAVFFDYDNDGYLDLFVTNSAEWTLDAYDSAAHYFPGMPTFWKMAESPLEHNILYHNVPDGKGGRKFVDVTARSGLAGQGWGGDVAVFDFNEDGYIDLFVTNMFGASQLYRNNGDGTFTEVTKDTLGRTSWGAIGSKVFDFNNDGRLDLLVVDMHSDMWLPPTVDPRTENKDSLKKKYSKATGPYYELKREQRLADAFHIRYDEVVFGNTLFQKLPSGKFEEVSDKANLETFWPWGIATGDFDNNGAEDVFLPSGMGFPFAYWPNALMMNNGDGTFTDRAAEAGIEPPRGGFYLDQKIGGEPASRSSRCAATADFRGDGRLDLVVNNFNGPAYFFRNEFPRKNYVAFRLTGTKSNRDAIGAVVRIYMGDEVMVRQVNPAGGYLSQSSKTLHFGLGDRAKIDKVEIRWPGWPPSKEPQTIMNPAINMLHPVTEKVDNEK